MKEGDRVALKLQYVYPYYPETLLAHGEIIRITRIISDDPFHCLIATVSFDNGPVISHYMKDLIRENETHMEILE